MNLRTMPDSATMNARHHHLLRAGRRFATAAIAGALAIAPLHAVAQAAVPEARVIVKLKADAKLLGVKSATAKGEIERRAKVLGSRFGIDAAAGPAVAETIQVVTALGVTSAEFAARLGRDADVEYAVPDVRARIAFGR